IWRWFETHAWPITYKKYAAAQVVFLKSQGVSQAVSLHYPHKEGMAGALNQFAFELGDKYPGFIIPFGSVHPDDADAEAILRDCFTKFAFKGIKIHCHVQHVAPDDRRMEPIYKVCDENRKIVLIHCGSGPHFKEQPTRGYGYDVTVVSGVRRFEKIVGKYPEITFVVPHLGYEEVEPFIHLLGDYPNLYLDTTMALSRFLPVEVKPSRLAENSDRLLFGTDFPNIPYEWKREKENLLAMGLGKEIEEKIFYRNAARLLDIEE
ncbi:MAG: amidohydrolase family protein, partial [Deltaproteobacteria bacterium]|nr:amidohydrolase family protein [Deltaproteobacteria bacterium]